MNDKRRINRSEMLKCTSKDVETYSTKEEIAKSLYVPMAIISLRKEQEMLGYGRGKLNRYQHKCLQLARTSTYPRTKQLDWEKLAAASA